MLIRIEETVINAVIKEIQKLKNDEALVKLGERLRRIDGEKLEVILQTKILDEIYSRRISNNLVAVYELRVSKGKGREKNIRALLCGFKEVNNVRQNIITLHLVKVWKKDTQKVPREYIDLAIKRFRNISEEI